MWKRCGPRRVRNPKPPQHTRQSGVCNPVRPLDKPGAGSAGGGMTRGSWLPPVSVNLPRSYGRPRRLQWPVRVSQATCGSVSVTGCTVSAPGEVAERLNAPVLKTGEGRPSVGSNPTLSANRKHSAGGSPAVRCACRMAPPGCRKSGPHSLKPGSGRIVRSACQRGAFRPSAQIITPPSAWRPGGRGFPFVSVHSVLPRRQHHV